ncbi:ATP-binding protein [Streptomyces vastus]|uniref:Histidine kinase/HSP90-like ATPase domain-containing protein n=1 Tax=Streptomyces vastus TaxID=285451 RepID=A0ABP6E399_9ACTN
MNATAPQLTSSVRTFAQRLSSTRRGARLARLLAAEELRTWPASPTVTERAEQIIAELAANAALHGRVQGRDFKLTLTLDEATGVVRIEATDTRGEKLPALPQEPQPDDESGRGLLLIAALADRWGTEPYPPSGKIVWAEVSEAIRFPNVIGWFGCGGHELRCAAGEMGVVGPLGSLVEVAGAVGARSAGGSGEEGPGGGGAVAGCARRGGSCASAAGGCPCDGD